MSSNYWVSCKFTACSIVLLSPGRMDIGRVVTKEEKKKVSHSYGLE
jgi:hypothetical protein